jgi:hypothetical protein
MKLMNLQEIIVFWGVIPCYLVLSASNLLAPSAE